jgi:hypothetical protein
MLSDEQHIQLRPPDEQQLLYSLGESGPPHFYFRFFFSSYSVFLIERQDFSLVHCSLQLPLSALRALSSPKTIKMC